MPNSCKFIFKSFSIAFLLSLVSCVSFNQSQSSEEKYIGKLTLFQKEKSFNYNFAIFPSENIFIIQVNKPLLGNVLNVKIDKFNGISTSPAPDIQTVAFIKNLNLDDFFTFISNCLRSNISENSLISYNQDKTNFDCEKRKEMATLITIKFENIYIKGVISDYK